MAEWYAVEVSGTTTDLTANLNAVEKQGYDIFSVVISPRGWTIVARKLQLEQKPEPKPVEAPPTPAADKVEVPRRGTVTLHKPRRNE